MSERLSLKGNRQRSLRPHRLNLCLNSHLKGHVSLHVLLAGLAVFGAAAPQTALGQALSSPQNASAAAASASQVMEVQSDRPSRQTQILQRLRRATAPTLTGTDPQGRAVAPDGLTDGAAYIEADQISTADDKTLTATGSVEMRHKSTTIRADQVSYDSEGGNIVAEGNAQAIGDDGSVTFADRLTFNETMSTGKGEMIASLSRDKSRLFAREFEQINEYTNELKDVIYTPCEICKSNGDPQQPGWSVQASKVTQRKDQEMIYFRNAVIKIKGVPVFYMPYMWAPNPESDRASGFMMPRINTSKRRGFSWEQPYLWSISPYSEMIISPQLNASVNPFLSVEYNRRFYSGLLQFRVGGTEDSYFDTRGNKNGSSDFRGFVLADGRFKINDDWRWNFTAQHIFDRYVMPDGRRRINADLFERYSIEDAYSNWNIGDYQVSQRNLINQAHIIRQTSNSWFSVSVANFQTLRVDSAATTLASVGLPSQQFQFVAADSAFFPVVMPAVQAQWSPRLKILGGRLTLKGSAIGLQHKYFSCPVTLPNNPTQTQIDAAEARAKARCVGEVPAFFSQTGIRPTGFDTVRMTGEVNWQGDIVTSAGVRLVPFVDVRQDYYRLSELGNGVEKAEVNRTYSTTGLTVSYPLMGRFGGTTVIFEPIAQFAVSPEYKVSDFLPVEDSQFIEFDATNLFSVNRSPGYDLYETGQRLNLGARMNFKFENNVRFDAVLGRTFRDKPLSQFMRAYQPDPAGPIYYYDAYGLADKKSDWVFSGRLDLGLGTYAYSRLRMDADDMRIVQNDSGLSWVGGQTRLTARYIRNDILEAPQIQGGQVSDFYGPNYENVQLYGQHFLTDRWGVSARIDYDLRDNKFRRSQLSAIYRDDCLTIEVVYQRNDTQIYQTNGKRGETIFLRLNLATLGKQKNTFNDVR